MSGDVVVHLHHSNLRFCGSDRPMRRFTLDESRVTCALCRAAIEVVAGVACREAEVVR